MKKIILKLKTKALCNIMILTIMSGIAVSTHAEVNIDSQAVSNGVNDIIKIVMDIGIGTCGGITLYGLVSSYLDYKTKDEEEREQTGGFKKIVKKHIFEFIILGLTLLILRSITIN